MAKYKDKWKITFPASIGNQTRPADGVDNTQEYNTDGLPQYMANDPVRYDLQNAVNSQLVSNDERLNEKIKRTSDDLAAHNKDPKAHATGIAGNAATASKLLTPRTISLTGKAAGSTTFDGSTNASINVTSVNADTASKLSTARKISITGNATGAANFDGSGDVSINVNVNESKHAAAATTVNATAPNGGAADLAFGTMAVNDYARIRVYGKDDKGALEIATADGGDEPIYARQYGGADWPNGRPGTVMNEAAILDSNGNTKFPKNVTAASFTGPLNGTATKAAQDTNGRAFTDTNAYMHISTLANGTDFNNVKTTGVYTCIEDNYPNRPRSSWGVLRVYNFSNVKQEYIPDNTYEVWERYFSGSWSAWSKVAASTADTCTGNASTATKLQTPRTISLTGNATGSATFDGSGNISISTNVNTATNADKLDGYHASDLFRHLGGNQTPVITDIFDRAGTIDMTTMSAADKATHKANINKASNATQNLWNTDTGIYAYGGDYDMSNGYDRGSLKLTQSYKNFDKILVVGTDDDDELLIYKLWDVWALANAFAGGSYFQLFHGGGYWFLYGSTRKGTWADYVLSTDTVWSCQDQNSGIVAIYGIKY